MIYNIHWTKKPILSLLLYTDLYVVIFKLLNFFGWQNIGGAMYVCVCVCVCVYRVGLVVSVSASQTVGREFASRPGHTKDHPKNVKTASLYGTHALG